MDTEISSTPPEENPEIIDIVTPPPGPAPRRNLLWVYLLPVAFALGMVASYFGFAYPLQGKLNAAKAQIASLEQANNSAAQQAAPEAPQQVRRYDIPVDGFPSFGPEDAPIVIVEFSDFECPFCKKWYDEVWPQIQSKYGDQVRLVYRDFPLFSIHPNASSAALAASCAKEQDKYWEFHNALFSGSYPLSREAYGSIATNLGMNVSTFNTCVDTQKYKASIEADYQFAADLGIQSTPTFFINGLAMVGAQPFEMFDQVITLELNGEIPQN